MKESHVRRIALALAVALLSVTGPTKAQDSNSPNPSASPSASGGQANPQDNGQLQQVTVTGYLVPRIGDGPQPVVTLDQDFFKEQADQTVAETCRHNSD